MKNDQVFTPALIVTKMLDLVGYENESIPTKTILEPSFGDGAFLNQILERIISFSKSNHLSPEETISILNNISGIEIDKELYQKTKSALIKKCKSHGIDYMWDNLICGDSTEIIESNKYDIVVMNPPLSINQQLCKRDRYASINHKKQLHTHLYHGGVVVS